MSLDAWTDPRLLKTLWKSIKKLYKNCDWIRQVKVVSKNTINRNAKLVNNKKIFMPGWFEI
ncbi:MAG TPA: hypothetical protein VEJ88_00045 [Dissulfurispiraceae bacterium]|nr:hypothetical protein [Dissulfurispiraceae bacterium]